MPFIFSILDPSVKQIQYEFEFLTSFWLKPFDAEGLWAEEGLVYVETAQFKPSFDSSIVEEFNNSSKKVVAEVAPLPEPVVVDAEEDLTETIRVEDIETVEVVNATVVPEEKAASKISPEEETP